MEDKGLYFQQKIIVFYSLILQKKVITVEREPEYFRSSGKLDLFMSEDSLRLSWFCLKTKEEDKR